MNGNIAQRYTQLQPLPRPAHYRSMSNLYKAFDTQNEQWVVVKTMAEQPEDPRRDQKMRLMFEREINIAISLQHDHILKVIDYGNSTQPKDAESFLVYPFIQDGSLSDLLHLTPAWKQWTLMQTADFIQQAASALIYMHRRSQPIVHWDIKADNFLVRRETGTTRIAHLFLCDFGVSRAQRAFYDETSQPWGTPNFMPPEQSRGQITCQSDQYALAMLACYLLTGKYPLEATHPDDWINVHQNIQPTPPRVLNPHRIKSHEIDDVIIRALNKAPEQRFPDIWIFAKELNNAIKLQETAAYAETLYVQPLPPTIYSPASQLDPIPLHPPINTGAYQIEIEPQPIIEPVQPIKNVWSSLPFISSQLLLEQELPTSPNSLCWSPEGNFLACLFLEHAPIIFESDGTKKVVSKVKTGHVACWSPYDDILAISSQKRIQGTTRAEINVVTASPLSHWPLKIPFQASLIDGMDWSVNGLLAVWPSGENHISIYDLTQEDLTSQSISSAQLLSTYNMFCGGNGALRWSPDGSLLAAGGKNGTLMCWRKGTQVVHWRNSDLRATVQWLAWSQDSTLLVVAFRDRRIVIWDINKNCIKKEWNNR